VQDKLKFLKLIVHSETPPTCGVTGLCGGYELTKWRYEQFAPVQKQDIFTYIREYCEDLIFDENDENFTISGEEELKKLLYGIEQRYYTTRQGGERRLANSITTL
jgi:hypothetical protein